jgi:hypothetical protein
MSAIGHDYQLGERVVALGGPMGLPDLTGVVIAAPRVEWAHPSRVGARFDPDCYWIRYGPGAAGVGLIHRSLLRRMTPADEAAFAALRRCRVCGCIDEWGCQDEWGDVCHWVEADLCSACVGAGERDA